MIARNTNQSIQRKPNILITYNSPKVTRSTFRSSTVSNPRDSSFERVYFSRTGAPSYNESPYYNSSPYLGNFAVVSKTLNLGSSFDPRTHQEIGLQGKYNYFRIEDEAARRPDPFEKEFDHFLNDNSMALDDIDRLNNSSYLYNSQQMKVTDKLHHKVRNIGSGLSHYSTIKEENKQAVRYSNGLNDIDPLDVLNESSLSRKDEERATKFLEDSKYVDIEQSNQRYGVQDTEIEQLDDILKSLE